MRRLPVQQGVGRGRGGLAPTRGVEPCPSSPPRTRPPVTTPSGCDPSSESGLSQVCLPPGPGVPSSVLPAAKEKNVAMGHGLCCPGDREGHWWWYHFQGRSGPVEQDLRSHHLDRQGGKCIPGNGRRAAEAAGARPRRGRCQALSAPLRSCPHLPHVLHILGLQGARRHGARPHGREQDEFPHAAPTEGTPAVPV